MAVTTDKHQLQLEIVNEAQTELGNMEKELNRLEKSLKGLKKDSEEYIATTKQIDQAKQQLGNFRKEMDLNKMSYQQLIKYQKDLQKEARAAFGTERFKQLQPELDRVNSKVREANTQIRGVTQSSNQMFASWIQLTPFAGQFNTLSQNVGQIKGGFDTGTAGAKGFRIALMAIPLIAIVTAITSLVSWFKRTERGAQELRVITAAVGQVFNSLMDVVSKIGEVIFDAFSNPKQAVADLWEAIKTNVVNRITGLIDTFQFFGKTIQAALNLDWDAVKENALATAESITQSMTGIDNLAGKMVNGVSNLYKEVRKDVEGAIALQERENQLRVDRREFMIREIELENQISELRLRGSDQTLTAAEREEALSEAIRLQNVLVGERQRLAQEEYLIQKDRNALSDSTEEDLEREAELHANVIRIRKQGNDQMRELFSMSTGLQKQLVAQQEQTIKKQLAAEKALTELRIEAMNEGLEKEIAKINLDYEEKMAAVQGNEEQMAEQLRILEQQRQQEIADARRLEEERIRLEDEEIQKEILEQKLLNALLTEEEFQDAMYELQREGMMDRLELLRAQHGEESLEYIRYYNEILKLDKEHNDRKVQNVKKAEEFKKKIESESLQASKDFINTGIDLLSQDEEARRKNAGVIKAFETAKVTTDGIREVAAIWKHAAELGPIAGPIVGVIRTAAAVARTTLAVNKINTTKFDRGGIFKGPRHSQGGSAVIDSVTGQKIAEVEAGEPYMILSRNTYANNRPIVDQLLYSSMYRDGAPIFETGGVMNPYRTGAGAQTATPAPGLPASAGANANQAAADQTPAAANISADLLVRLINEVIALRRDLLAGEIQAKVVHSQLEKVEAEINTIRNDAALRR